MFIRPAHKEDLKAILDVLDAAKGIMRASGNTRQWENGYPSEEVILHDIRKGSEYPDRYASGQPHHAALYSPIRIHLLRDHLSAVRRRTACLSAEERVA